jgi:hypothetical protein
LATGADKSSANWAAAPFLSAREHLWRRAFGIRGSGHFGREWVNVDFLPTIVRNEGAVSHKK